MGLLGSILGQLGSHSLGPVVHSSPTVTVMIVNTESRSFRPAGNPFDINVLSEVVGYYDTEPNPQLIQLKSIKST